MRDDTPSRTAAFVAATRQLGQLLPLEARLVDDPYGGAFVTPAVARALARAAPGLAPLALLPGLRAWLLYMQVRTRVIDDALRDFRSRGGRQLVLLGAGYDCRALRLPELAGAVVIEVDHPATQSRKRRVLERLGARSAARYLTWDFERRAMAELPDALAAAGLDRASPTFTIWEGVTMYLTEPAIDASLRAIRAWSAAGSELAMTYVTRSRLRRPSPVTRAMMATVATLGEPWRFGWAPDALPDYLADRGWQLVSDVTMPAAARALLPPRDAAQLADPERRFALATASESIALAR